jgi:hypothetical protein
MAGAVGMCYCTTRGPSRNAVRSVKMKEERMENKKETR